jgi:hypothetical protein
VANWNGRRDQRCGPTVSLVRLRYLPRSWFVLLVFLADYYIGIRVLDPSCLFSRCSTAKEVSCFVQVFPADLTSCV